MERGVFLYLKIHYFVDTKEVVAEWLECELVFSGTRAQVPSVAEHISSYHQVAMFAGECNGQHRRAA